MISYHLTPIRMVFIKKTRNNNGWQECGEERTVKKKLHCWWECKFVQPL